MTDPAFRQQFLNGMSRAAATVNVVTTDGKAGRSGVTVSAMSSVTADGEAPVILVCLHHQGKAAQTTIDNGAFVVNVLREDQSFISDTFAGRRETSDGDIFSCVEWTPMSTGCPRIVDPLVAFDCKILSAERVGTHHVVLGEVRDIFVADSGNPLIFANRSYGAAERIQRFSAEDIRPENALRIGVLSSFGAHVLPSLIKEMESVHGRCVIDLYEGDQRKISELLNAGDIDLALLHDVELGDELVIDPLTTCKPQVLLPAGHALARRKTVSLSDLTFLPLVLLDAPPARHYFLSLFEQLEIEPRIAYRPWWGEMARSMVAQGLGYSLIASPAAAESVADNNDIVIRALSDEVPSIQLVLARRPGELPPLAQRFADLSLRVYRS